MKINLKTRTRIRYNGREYSSFDELPEPVRAAYARMLEQQDSGAELTNQSTEVTASAPEGGVIVKRSVVFNGKKFASPDEMPEADRKLYNDLMQLVRVKGSASRCGEIDDESSGTRPQPMSSSRSTPVIDTGWLTPNQKKLVAVVAALILIAALVFIAIRAL